MRIKKIKNIVREEGLNAFVRRSIFHLFQSPLVVLTKLLNKIIEDNDDVVLFGSRHGEVYEGNSKYVFEKMRDNTTNISPYYIIGDMNDYKRLKGDGKEVIYNRSFQCLYMLSKSKLVCVTHNLNDVAPKRKFVPDDVLSINLQHADPVKGEINHTNKSSQYVQKITTSKWLVNLYEEAGYDSNKYAVTGYPRNDALFDIGRSTNIKWGRIIGKREFDHTILYAPTQRKPYELGPTELFPFEDFDVVKLKNFLEENNILLCLRLHPREMRRIREGENKQYEEYSELQELIETLIKYENVELIGTDKFQTANEFLPFIDILITDYSSIYHDYLLLNNPIIFFPYDYPDFKEKKGFKYDYLSNLPGPRISSFSEFCEYINNIIHGKKDTHAHKREVLRNKIHDYKDAKSSERAIQLIIETINSDDFKNN